ncbi:MAG: aldo/keto reductase [Spirochaetota bacterium]
MRYNQLGRSGRKVSELCLGTMTFGHGIVTSGPLAGGFLSGKYAPGERSRPGTCSEEGWAFPEGFFSPHADDVLRVLIEVAAELGRSPAETAIRWLLEQSPVSSVIVGARTIEQFRSNIAAAGWTMPAEAPARLNEVSAPRIAYPEAMEWPRDASRLSAIARR